MNKEQFDVRPCGVRDFEVRSAGREGQTVVGYAAVFNEETNIGGMFIEKIDPAAFEGVLARSDVHALYNHDYGKVLGRSSSGTLRMITDTKGLMVEIDMPDTTDARDLAVQISRGDIDQMSFMFSMDGGVQEWNEEGDLPVRTIKQLGELFDVSICPRGAYPTTECGMRSLESYRSRQTRRTNFHAARKRRMKMNLSLRG